MPENKTEKLTALQNQRNIARAVVIDKQAKCKKAKQLYYDLKAEYDDAVSQYNKADREYAFAQHENKKLTSTKETKPYNTAKRTAAKAIAALKNLPKDIRDKIIADAQDDLF